MAKEQKSESSESKKEIVLSSARVQEMKNNLRNLKELMHWVRGMKKYPQNLKEIMPDIDDTSCDFAAFLADRFSDDQELVPLGFLMASQLALIDLEKGIDGFTQKPIDRKYAITRLPREHLRLLNLVFPTIAKAVTPQDFAAQVEEIEKSVRNEAIEKTKLVYGEEGIPEVKIPGIDPFKTFKETGEIPPKGILLRAEFFFKGNGVFTIYDYNNIERVEISEQGENRESQYLHVSFKWDDNSRLLCLGYEHPNYPYKSQEPYDRSMGSYIPYAFANLDIVGLPSSGFLNHAPAGRLLILKSAHHLGNLSTRLDQHPIHDTLWGKSGQAVRLFEPEDFEGVAEAIKVATRDLIRLDPNAAEVIKCEVIKRLSQKEE